jgi:heme/copper-type cytochrome/quinol oxidase subunit 2
VKERIDAAVRSIVYGGIAAAAGVAAFLFLAMAAFFWTQQHYDTIIACGAVGGLFLVVALIALTALAISRRRAAREKHEASANTLPAWLADPAIILTAIQIFRSIKLGKLLPIALAGIAAFGAANLVDKRPGPNGRKPAPKETKRAA